MIITQSKDVMAYAAKLEAEVLANLEARDAGPNYTGQEAERRYFKGYRGELAVRTWLIMLALRFIYRVHTDSYSHKSEFILPFGGKENRVEVKTAGAANHKDMRYPIKQAMDYEILLAPHLIGGVDDPRVKICGWLGIKDELDTERVPGFRVRPLNTLRDLNTLPKVILQCQTHEEWLADYNAAS